MSRPIPVFRFDDGPALEAALRAAFDRVWASGRFVLGAEVAAFESEFAAYCGVGHCVGMGNGTDALELALRGCGVGAGDRVATVANAASYVSTALDALGAVPVYVDVDDVTLTLSPSALADSIEGVRAVVATHLYGRLADMEAIEAVTRPRGIALLEDCAQAHGARRAGRRAGAWGVAGCFSFYPTKNLGALGDGGAVVTDDAALADRLRSLRQYGWGAKYEVEQPGGRNSRLDELQAALLRAKLPLLDGWNAARLAIAERYRNAFADLPLRMPSFAGEEYVAHLFVVRTPARDALRARLAEAGIAAEVHYPVPDHRQPGRHTTATLDLPSAIRLPATEAACAEVLSLPCFPGLTDEEVGRVIASVRAACSALPETA